MPSSFAFPFSIIRPDPSVFVIGAAASLAAALGGGAIAVRRAAALPPAEAMRPPAPPVYRRTAVTASGRARFLDQPTRIILRQIIRWPLRSALDLPGHIPRGGRHADGPAVARCHRPHDPGPVLRSTAPGRQHLPRSNLRGRRRCTRSTGCPASWSASLSAALARFSRMAPAATAAAWAAFSRCQGCNKSTTWLAGLFPCPPPG